MARLAMLEELVPLVEEEDDVDDQAPQRRQFEAISDHISTDAALAAMQHIDGLTYRYLHNQGSRSATSLYECVSHLNCQKRIRLVSVVDEGGDTVVSLQQDTHEHAEEPVGGASTTTSKKRGISPLYKHEVDAMLSGGAGPKKCRLLLLRKYKNDTRMIALMPDELQLKNRKATLKRNKQGNLFTRLQSAGAQCTIFFSDTSLYCRWLAHNELWSIA